jgi:hypothetical protein
VRLSDPDEWSGWKLDRLTGLAHTRSVKVEFVGKGGVFLSAQQKVILSLLWKEDI